MSFNQQGHNSRGCPQQQLEHTTKGDQRLDPSSCRSIWSRCQGCTILNNTDSAIKSGSPPSDSCKLNCKLTSSPSTQRPLSVSDEVCIQWSELYIVLLVSKEYLLTLFCLLGMPAIQTIGLLRSRTFI
jgi:hypothetical protein